MSWQDTRQLSPRAFEAAIAQLGLNQSSCARFVGVSDRTVRRYCTGDAEIPTSTVLLLMSMIAHGETPQAPARKRRHRHG